MNTASPAEAFTLLTVLMSQPTPNAPTGYSLRTLYTPNFPGLLSLIHSFNTILSEQFPTLAQHLESMGLTTQLYAPQWFLSMFAVTAAPLDTLLLRIWDLVMMEGHNGGYTMIRVGLALMKLKQQVLLNLTEMEDGLRLLLSKDLWTDIEPNTLIGLAGGDLKTLVPNERLAELDAEHCAKMSKSTERKAGGDMQLSVGRFFGKLKATASQLSVDTTNLVAPPMLRSLSRASFASSASPQDAPEERPMLLRVQTEGTPMSRSPSSASARGTSDNERALHGQIEELVRVLGEVQRRVGESERERDVLKGENVKLREMLTKVAEVMTPPLQTPSNPLDELSIPPYNPSLTDEISEILFSQSTISSPTSAMSAYAQSEAVDSDLRTQLSETQHMLNQERQANALLQQQLSTTETELSRTRTALFDLRGKLAEASRRERTPSKEAPATPVMERSPSANGSLRELKLVVKTEQATPGRSLGSANSAGGSWGGWFGRT
jgi:Rab-GTPase-TBC domain